MAIQRLTAVVIKKEELSHTLQANNEEIVLQLSDRVKNMYNKGLEVGKVYNISYVVETKLITYAKETETTKQEKEPTKETISPYDHKQKLIISKSCQKDAIAIMGIYYKNVEFEGDVEKLVEEIINLRDNLIKDIMEKYN